MSNKLSNDEMMKSLQAMNNYRNDNIGGQKKRVVVVKNDLTIFNDIITVNVGNYNIYQRVDILWEDANYDYKENGLYGYYSSTYNKATYNNGVLNIYSDDIIISIIS